MDRDRRFHEPVPAGPTPAEGTAGSPLTIGASARRRVRVHSHDEEAAPADDTVKEFLRSPFNLVLPDSW